MTKVGLIGCGGWGKNLARSLNDIGALAIIVDPSPDVALLAHNMGVLYSASTDSLMNDLSVNAVAIATPAETHVSLGVQAFEAGKHVYVEKPIALSIDEADILAQSATAAKRVLMVGHLLQYHPVFRKMLELRQNGRFGRVYHLISSRMNLGMVRNEENVMWSFSPHDVSMVLELMQSRPARVRAVGSTILQPGIPDMVTLHITFENNATAEIRSSWLHPEKEQKLTLIGSKAMAVFDDRADWQKKLTVTDYSVEYAKPRPVASRQNDEQIDVDYGEPLALEMRHFLECIADNQLPRTGAKEAISVLKVLQMAQTSLDGTGEWVDA